MKTGKIEPSAIISGILVLLFLSIFLYGFEWGIFMSKVTGVRRASGFDNSVDAGALVMKDKGFLAYRFLFIFIKYAIASYVVARSVRQAVLRNVMIFGAIGIISLYAIMYFYSLQFVSDGTAVFDFPVFALLERLWALLVCFAVGWLTSLKRKTA